MKHGYRKLSSYIRWAGLLVAALLLFLYFDGKRAEEGRIPVQATDEGASYEATYENNGNIYQGTLSECWELAERTGGGKIVLMSDVSAHAYDPSTYEGTSYTENGVQRQGISHAVTRFTGGLAAMRVTSGMSVTLDLNGHVLDRNMSAADGTADRAYTIEIFGGGSFTLMDSVGTGRLTGGYGSSCIDGTQYGSCVIVHDGGTFVLSGAEISGNTGRGAVTGQGTVVLSGDARITGNLDVAGRECNLYVSGNMNASVDGLGSSANIGITAAAGREMDAVACPEGDITPFYSDLGLGTYLNNGYVAVGEETECEWEAEFHSHTGAVYTGTFAEMFARMKTDHSGTLKIMRNITVSGTYVWNVWGTAVIDFNGHVVTASGNEGQYFLTVDQGATAGITLTDSTGRVRETARRVEEAGELVWDAGTRTYTYYVSYAEDGGTDTGMILATDEVTADFSRLGGLDVSGYTRAILVKTGSSVTISGGAHRSEKGFLHSTAAGSKVSFTGGYIYGSGTSNVTSGGAFHMANGESLSIIGGVIAGCQAKQGGAVRADTLTTLSVTGGTIAQCKGAFNGGAFYISNNCRNISFGSVLLCGNASGERGGAVMLSKNTAAFTGTVFAGNSATDGGALQLLSEGSSASLTGCMLIGNSAKTGGAISQESGVSMTVSMSGCTVVRNQADMGGGILFRKGQFLLGDGLSISRNSDSNVYLANEAVMTLTCVPSSMNIGVTAEDEGKNNTVQIVYNQEKWDISNCSRWFFSDNGHDIWKQGDYVVMGMLLEGDEVEWVPVSGTPVSGTFDEMWAKMAESGKGTLKLLRDVYITDSVYSVNNSSLNVTLDLNGHVLHASTSQSGKNLFTVYNNLSNPFIITDSTGKAIEARETVDKEGDMSYNEAERILTYYVQRPDGRGVVTEKVTVDLSGYGGLDVDGYARALYAANGWIDVQGGAHRSRNGFLHSVWAMTKLELSGGYVFDSGSSNTTYGGAIWFQAGASLKVRNATVIGCRASNGGGIYMSSGSMEIQDSTFTQCTASWSGGALYQNADNGSVDSSLLCLNKTSGGDGGAASLINATITDTAFTGNSSEVDSGALRVFQNSSLIIDGCTFRNNTAKGNGGGIHISGNTPNISLKNTDVSGNTASKNGSGICVSSGKVSVYDGLVVRDNTDDNLYLAEGNVLVLDKSVKTGLNVRVTTQEKPKSGYNVPIVDDASSISTMKAEKWFHSDEGYYVWYDNGYVWLSLEPFEDVMFDGVLVQFYAWTERLDFSSNTGSALSIIDTSGGVLPTNDRTPSVTNIYVDDAGNVMTNLSLTQIYANKDVEPGTINLDEVNSFYRENYRMYEVWVAKPDTSASSKDSSEWNVVPYAKGMELALEKGAIVRIVAQCTDGDWNSDVLFYDYDITDGGFYLSQENALAGTDKQPTSTQPGPGEMDEQWVRTARYGINVDENYSGSGAKLALGNDNTNTDWRAEVWQSPTGPININRYNRATNGVIATFAGAAYGIPSHLDEDGNIVYSEGLDVPALFSRGTAEGKSTYADYGFDFIRQGDTYTLSAVSGTGLGSLEKFHHPGIYDGVQNSTTIWSNGFWPMDWAPSWGTDGHDAKFGSDERYKNYTILQANGSKVNKERLPVADAGMDHNSYFGFQFSITFSMPEGYRGPMEYIFFGDDDMWVFLDGKLICDIGGVHSAIGEYVNLWDHLEKDDTAEHTLSVFYTERGASGSTCWMQFTMPNVVEATKIPTSFSYSFGKTDEDGTALANAQFGLYADAECMELLKWQTSGVDGRVTFTDLMDGQTYWIKEMAAPEGFLPDDTIYKLSQDAEGVWQMYGADGELPVETVVNVRDAGPRMPNTGRTDALLLLLSGVGMLLISVLMLFAGMRRKGNLR